MIYNRIYFLILFIHLCATLAGLSHAGKTVEVWMLRKSQTWHASFAERSLQFLLVTLVRLQVHNVQLAFLLKKMKTLVGIFLHHTPSSGVTPTHQVWYQRVSRCTKLQDGQSLWTFSASVVLTLKKAIQIRLQQHRGSWWCTTNSLAAKPWAVHRIWKSHSEDLNPVTQMLVK